jgi:hypothetical protein
MRGSRFPVESADGLEHMPHQRLIERAMVNAVLRGRNVIVLQPRLAQVEPTRDADASILLFAVFRLKTVSRAHEDTMTKPDMHLRLGHRCIFVMTDLAVDR